MFSKDDPPLFLGFLFLTILIITIPALSHHKEDEKLIAPKIEQEIILSEPIGHRIVTQYNAVEEQTDDTPCISASGMNVCETNKKICASNEFPFGTLLLVGDTIWEVQDRTNSRYSHRLDLLVEDYNEAIEWGVQTHMIYLVKQ